MAKINDITITVNQEDITQIKELIEVAMVGVSSLVELSAMEAANHTRRRQGLVDEYGPDDFAGLIVLIQTATKRLKEATKGGLNDEQGG